MNDRLLLYARELDDLAAEVYDGVENDDMDRAGLNIDLIMEVCAKMLSIVEAMQESE